MQGNGRNSLYRDFDFLHQPRPSSGPSRTFESCEPDKPDINNPGTDPSSSDYVVNHDNHARQPPSDSTDPSKYRIAWNWTKNAVKCVAKKTWKPALVLAGLGALTYAGWHYGIEPIRDNHRAYNKKHKINIEQKHIDAVEAEYITDNDVYNIQGEEYGYNPEDINLAIEYLGTAKNIRGVKHDEGFLRHGDVLNVEYRQGKVPMEVHFHDYNRDGIFDSHVNDYIEVWRRGEFEGRLSRTNCEIRGIDQVVDDFDGSRSELCDSLVTVFSAFGYGIDQALPSEADHTDSSSATARRKRWPADNRELHP